MPTTISAEDFDARFEAGEDMTPFLDLSTAYRLGDAPKRVNLDMPTRMIQAFDREATHIGVSRQAMIKTVLAAHLKAIGRDPNPTLGNNQP